MSDVHVRTQNLEQCVEYIYTNLKVPTRRLGSRMTELVRLSAVRAFHGNDQKLLPQTLALGIVIGLGADQSLLMLQVAPAHICGPTLVSESYFVLES